MKTSGGMKNLEGVRQVSFYNGSNWCPEDIPFTSCHVSGHRVSGREISHKADGCAWAEVESAHGQCLLSGMVGYGIRSFMEERLASGGHRPYDVRRSAGTCPQDI